MIELAKSNDTHQIISLWQACFGDSRDYIENFLSKRFNTENCMVFREDDVIVSMLFLLDGKIIISGEAFDSYYLYAACTALHHRNSGLMVQLLEKSFQYAAMKNKDLICLVPANEKLFYYYSRFGFTACFKRKELRISRGQLNLISGNCVIKDIPTIDRIAEVRNRSFSSGDYFVWDGSAIDYAILENRLNGGSAVFAKTGEIIAGYAIFSEENDIVIVKEFCALTGYMGSVAKLLAEATKDDTFSFSLPLWFPLTADNFIVRDNGMLKPLSVKGELAAANVKNAYIGLTLE